MDLQQAKNLIKGTFNDSFDRLKFIQFIKELLNEIDESKAQSWNKQYVKHAFHGSINRYERIGTYTAPEGEKVDILIVYLEKETTLERARTLQRNFAAHHLKTRAEKDAGLVAFVSPNNDDWRFSLVKMEYNLEKTDLGKVKVQEEITPSKRFSFIVGKNENSHTAQKQLLPILKEDKYNPTFKEIEEAFNIEKVTKEFFNRYTELYFQFKEHLDTLVKLNEKINNDFKEKEISTVDFAKKTLGQIVFLYFLQKKGWFGVAPDKKWGEGPKNFLRELFKKRDKYGDNFFNDVLEPLFYEALAQDRGVESIYPRLNNCRMPFLNGGLFEPIRNYSWETTDIVIPDELFSNDYKDPKTGDIGSGILDVFDRYNFTVKENDPLEKEVAVDPEMLGKVFENLLEIKDRKSKGAFYTPREIVHYMCQESLINYLESETNNEIPRDDLEVFIQKGDRIIENDKIALARKIEREKKYGSDKYKDSTYTLLLPEPVRERADKLDQLLRDIKVADPAVGSGAFPLGMINEIVRARKVLNIYIKDEISDYDLKKHTITHSIYGVDLDPGAVDIAKLRLWLALVVDEETPHPLPNLEHKIMQGNSLISDYEGIKLFDESIFSKEKSQKAEQLALGFGKTNSELKMEALQDKIETFINEAQRTKKQNLKKEIDDLKWELIEETLKEQGKDDKLQEIKNLRNRNIKPFFIWKLEFSDVFKEKGGFDVVIGNPPYVSANNLKKQLGQKKYMFLKSQFKTAKGTVDLYIYFMEKGVEIMNSHGILTYITPNRYLSASYGKSIREYLYYNTALLSIADYSEVKVFREASTYPIVSIYSKNTKSNYKIKIRRFSEEKQNLVLKNMDSKLLNFLKDYIWGFLLNDKIDVTLKVIEKSVSLEEAGTVNATSTTAEADLFHSLLNENDGIKLINTGTIDPYLTTWGKERMTDKGSRYLKPFLQIDSKIISKNRLDLYRRSKIIFAKIALRAEAFFDEHGEYASVNTNCIHSFNQEFDPKYILAWVNSNLFQYVFECFFDGLKMSGGYLLYSAPNLKYMWIKKISENQQKTFANLVDQILVITTAEDYDHKNPPLEQKELEAEIDKMVYELYGLTEEEIKIIENNL